MSLRSRGGVRATSPISGSVRSHAHAKKFVISSKISAIYSSAPRSLHPEALSQPSIVVYVVAFLARLI